MDSVQPPPVERAHARFCGSALNITLAAALATALAMGLGSRNHGAGNAEGAIYDDRV
ncbi:MAG: hypothetical protein RIB43_12145 [Rhodospirillaceae bacterium]